MAYPTVVEAPNSAPIVQVEKFAPVFAVVCCEDDKHFVEYMNHAHYCLGATIYGDEASKMAELMSAPHVACNQSLLSVEEADAHRPFGGRNQSGFVLQRGVRTDGPILFSVETSALAI
jgi:acyl-CoA reductase-like NAD-dependent aldehyde dehydrogenase